MTIVWWIKEFKPNNPEMERRAKILFQQFDKEKFEVVLPSVVLSELLCLVEPDGHEDFIAAMTLKFYIAAFDAKCATIAARIYRDNKHLRRKAQKNDRKAFRADTLIVATCKAYPTERFYSHDARCRRMAESIGLKAYDLPSHSTNLFVDNNPDMQW